MPILKAFVFPHPPLAVPAVGGGKEKEIKNTLAALDEAAREINRLKPETILFITPHNVVYADYFHISPESGAKGDLARFGASSVKFSAKYDQELVDEIAKTAYERIIPAGTQGEKDKNLDHGMTVPMWFINKFYQQYKSLRISPSGLDVATHYRFGQCINHAIKETGRKVVLIASGDLSHSLSDKGPYSFAPEGAIFDEEVTKALASGDFLKLLRIPESLREKAAECGYNPLLILAGCFDKTSVSAKLLSYEGPFGVGYCVAGITPLAGNTPLETDNERDFLTRYNEIAISEALSLKDNEDAYRSLARQSLEYVITEGKQLPVPSDLPEELLTKKAGVFVTLYKQGRLRGCIGTIAPTCDCIASEIIRNAISAGLNDTRFDPVKRAELPYLNYKVDVLGEIESISGPEELDVKRYGVIVTAGEKRGLLLPNLDGIDTVSEQIEIARKKGGILDHEQIILERFEVIRHE